MEKSHNTLVSTMWVGIQSKILNKLFFSPLKMNFCELKKFQISKFSNSSLKRDKNN